ncbi:MAG: preprotein translocase subunit SecY [Phycisphaeraceae bacterium]|nr:preprotein translocase subunit SecY [Phycisphaeraceae bacterium]
MLQALINVFRIAELRNKVLFTLGMLAVYRMGHFIPLPGVNQEALVEFFRNQVESGSVLGKATQVVTMFSGGALGQSTIFGLGIMPYISASIIFQLLASVVPSIKAMRNEGPSGQRKIQEWTRLATLGLCLVQSVFWLQYIGSLGLVYPQWMSTPLWWVMAVSALTAGTMFLMWLGEQIDKYGIGNGVSMIIAAGILANMPSAVVYLIDNFGTEPDARIGVSGLMFILAGFVVVVGGAVIMTIAQRRIPIQQAKHTRGRKVFGGQKSYLPLRVNHGGVMPVIFASSLMIFPAIVLTAIANAVKGGGGSNSASTFFEWLSLQMSFGNFLHVMFELVLIYFFSYFWITVQFNPEEMSKNLRDHGSFIPGLRPGPRTAEYLEAVMERITFVGAAFLSVIALAPTVIHGALGLPMNVTQFLGGTGLLIVVSVLLDFIQRLEANLLMRNYAGFLAKDDGSSAGRIRSARAS